MVHDVVGDGMMRGDCEDAVGGRQRPVSPGRAMLQTIVQGCCCDGDDDDGGGGDVMQWWCVHGVTWLIVG